MGRRKHVCLELLNKIRIMSPFPFLEVIIHSKKLRQAKDRRPTFLYRLGFYVHLGNYGSFGFVSIKKRISCSNLLEVAMFVIITLTVP